MLGLMPSNYWIGCTQLDLVTHLIFARYTISAFQQNITSVIHEATITNPRLSWRYSEMGRRQYTTTGSSRCLNNKMRRAQARWRYECVLLPYRATSQIAHMNTVVQRESRFPRRAVPAQYYRLISCVLVKSYCDQLLKVGTAVLRSFDKYLQMRFVVLVFSWLSHYPWHNEQVVIYYAGLAVEQPT